MAVGNTLLNTFLFKKFSDRTEMSGAQGEVSYPLLLADADVLSREPSTSGSQRHTYVGLEDASERPGVNSPPN